MLFNSYPFLVFFIIVTTLYFIFPYQKRWLLLLLSSCYFYMAFVPVYILILGFTIVVDYFAGIWIENAKGEKRKLFLTLSLIANIGVLAFFKYFNFINHNLTYLFQGFGINYQLPYLSILLPIGLSFHTFQAMSYTIEVYRGNHPAERHFGIYALYVMFYPQLVAGPIERPQNILYQFREKHDFNYNQVTGGLKLAAWGLFKKVVIADRLSIVVDTVYNHPKDYNSFSLILATVFFAFQIFCDFSGYSDMAIGIARVMGFKLLTNFNKPYQAKSLHEFWQRWHISLSTWFRDYLYISLGGNRVTIPRWYLNLFIVFLVSGLWHGANWTYVIWGALHGFYLIFALVTKNFRQKISNALFIDKIIFLPTLTTFLLVCFAWIFFRADNVQTAFYIAKHIFTGMPDLLKNHQHLMEGYNLNNKDLALCVLLIVFLELVQYLQIKINLAQKIAQKPVYIRFAAYFILLILIAVFGEFSQRQFIYFQF
ncbi:MBOAT family protein [Mucilaginibacter sp. HMF7410]|uniref:MBOAT family protein n=2 Tax=Mucilaginibacter arboris TaxID=2682090 RepID=A0A7K1STY3_9SPHI|nr:MBOAT family protein [Mucilaginibacter arboris]